MSFKYTVAESIFRFCLIADKRTWCCFAKSFYSIKTSRTFGTRVMGLENSWDCFKNIWKLMTSEMQAIVSPKNCRNFGSNIIEINWYFREEIFESLGIPPQVVHFSENVGNIRSSRGGRGGEGDRTESTIHWRSGLKFFIHNYRRFT